MFFYCRNSAQYHCTADIDYTFKKVNKIILDVHDIVRQESYRIESEYTCNDVINVFESGYQKESAHYRPDEFCCIKAAYRKVYKEFYEHKSADSYADHSALRVISSHHCPLS